MAARRINVRKWARPGSDERYESYEEWRLVSASQLAGISLLHAQDALGGVQAPKGWLWAKSIEVHPPDGWTEVS